MKKSVLAVFNLLVGLVFVFGMARGVEATSFSNSTPITIPDSGNGTPYPSRITVSGVVGTVADVNVILTGLTHTFPEDIGILLVGPGGQNVVLMDNTGGINPISGVNLTIDDQASSSIPDPIFGSLTSGTYTPTNFSPTDVFPSPAPGGPYGSFLSVFNGTNPNGTWSLFIEDFVPLNSGSLDGGWTLQIQTPEPSSVLLLGLGLFIMAGYLRRIPRY